MGGVGRWVDRRTCNRSVVSSNSIEGSRNFREQKNLTPIAYYWLVLRKNSNVISQSNLNNLRTLWKSDCIEYALRLISQSQQPKHLSITVLHILNSSKKYIVILSVYNLHTEQNRTEQNFNYP